MTDQELRQTIIARYAARRNDGTIVFCGSESGKVVYDRMPNALDAARELHDAGADRMKPYVCPAGDGLHFHLRSVRIAP